MRRSERASSLALPHNSLLDFYDKEQEQCSSVALLPTTVNVVVRRHSSHYYPMLEEKQPPPPLQQQQQSLKTHSQIQMQTRQLNAMTATGGALSTLTVAIPELPQYNYNHNKVGQLAMQDMQSMSSLPLSSLVSTINATG